MKMKRKTKNESVQNTPKFNINPGFNYKIESFEENKSILKSNSSIIEYNEKLSSFRKVNKTKVVYNEINNIDNKKRVSLSQKVFFCTCEKSMCIKKYCECYANNESCDKRCSCVNCKNITINNYEDDVQSVMSKNNKEVDNISCTCTKSNCIKNYCDCFKANSRCGSKCRCIDCKNNLAFVMNKELKDKNAKKNIIEYIRVEINGKDIRVKEGKVIFFTNEEASRKTSEVSNRFIFKVEDKKSSTLKKKRVI